MQSTNEKTALAVLILLALSNLIFFLLSSHSGPLVGFIVAAVVALHWWRKKDSLFLIVMSLIWIFIHLYELVVTGVSSLPVLFYMNVLLPSLLLYCGFRQKRQEGKRFR
jgi:hypothetical protein